MCFGKKVVFGNKFEYEWAVDYEVKKRFIELSSLFPYILVNLFFQISCS